MIRLKRTIKHIESLFQCLSKPFLLVAENVDEAADLETEARGFSGGSLIYGSVGHAVSETSAQEPADHPLVIDRRALVLFIENTDNWVEARGIIDRVLARTILYAETKDFEEAKGYISKYNPFFQELIELSPSRKVYGIKLEDLKRTFACKTAWENKDWICIEESEGPIPGAKTP